MDHNKLCKILKEMGIPDYLTCLLRNLYASQEVTVRTGHGKTVTYADQEATVRTGHRKTDWFQIGKGVHQGYVLSRCLFNFYAE